MEVDQAKDLKQQNYLLKREISELRKVNQECLKHKPKFLEMQ